MTTSRLCSVMSFTGFVAESESLSSYVWRCRNLSTTKRQATCKSSVCHNEAPGYLQELCMPVNTNTRRSTLRPASGGQLIVPRTKTKAGERAFSVAGPLAWNSLPVAVRQLSSLSSFKRHLETHLFNASFPSWCCKAPLRFLLTLWCYLNYQVIIIIIIIIKSGIFIVTNRKQYCHHTLFGKYVNLRKLSNNIVL